eukprot:UN01067
MDTGNDQNINGNESVGLMLKDRIKQIAKEGGSGLLSAKFLLIAGITISCGFMIEGLLCFALCSINVRSYILSFYYIIFGLFSIGAELKFKAISTYVRILFSYSGRGFWYIFLGTLALGSEWWAILVALFLIVLGGLNVTAGCQRGRSVSKGDADNNDNDNVNNRNRLGSESAVPPKDQLDDEHVNVEINGEQNSDKMVNPHQENKDNAYDDY